MKRSASVPPRSAVPLKVQARRTTFSRPHTQQSILQGGGEDVQLPDARLAQEDQCWTAVEDLWDGTQVPQ